jgi:hypothetical protein
VCTFKVIEKREGGFCVGSVGVKGVECSDRGALRSIDVDANAGGVIGRTAARRVDRDLDNDGRWALDHFSLLDD